MRTKKWLILGLSFFLTSGLIAHAQHWHQLEGDTSFQSQRIRISEQGHTVIVGYSYKDRAAVFKYDTIRHQWAQLGDTLKGSGDFGIGVAISKDGYTIAIGASHNTDNSEDYKGMVVVYRYDGSRWVQKGNIIYADTTDRDNYFGSDVDISMTGNRIAVGIIYHSSNSKSKNLCGAVKVYDFNSSSNVWEQVGNKVEGASSYEYMGYRVRFNETADEFVALSTVYGDDNSIVRVYKLNNGTWSQMGNDISGDKLITDVETIDISANGNTLVFGYPSLDSVNTDVGAANIFEFDGNDWQQKGENMIGTIEYGRLGKCVGLNKDGMILAYSQKNYIKFLNYNTTSSTWEKSDSLYVINSLTDGNINDAMTYLTTLQSSKTIRLYTSICKNTSSINDEACGSYLSPSGHYIWTHTGVYKDTLQNQYGCDSVITVNLTVHPLPTVDLGNDTTICQDQTLELNAGEGVSYQWNTGDTTQKILVSDSGTYSVAVTNEYGCVSADTIKITTKSCQSGFNSKISASKINFYPNPVNNNLYFSEIKSDVTIQIMTLTGQTLNSQIVTPDNPYIDMSAYPKGMYIISLKNKDAQLIFKVIKH